MNDHFREVTKMTKTGKGASRSIRDLELSRYACYILVQNADASKPIVAHAMDYFAVQTRRQELADADTFAQLSEDEKRLIYQSTTQSVQPKTCTNSAQSRCNYFYGTCNVEDYAEKLKSEWRHHNVIKIRPLSHQSVLRYLQ